MNVLKQLKVLINKLLKWNKNCRSYELKNVYYKNGPIRVLRVVSMTLSYYHPEFKLKVFSSLLTSLSCGSHLEPG